MSLTLAHVQIGALSLGVRDLSIIPLGAGAVATLSRSSHVCYPALSTARIFTKHNYNNNER